MTDRRPDSQEHAHQHEYVDDEPSLAVQGPLQDLTDTTTFTPLRRGARMHAESIGDTNPYLMSGHRVYKEIPSGAKPEPFGSGSVAGIIGEGTFTRAYRVLCSEPRENRVVKVVLPDAPWEAIEAIRVRWGRWAEVTHRHFPTIHRTWEHRGLPCIEMAYLTGKPLQDLLHGPPLDPHVAMALAQLVAQLCSDCCANNDTQNPGIVPHVVPGDLLPTDGTLKALEVLAPDGPRIDRLVVAEEVIGTMLYLPPECPDRGSAEPHALVYTAGALLYHLATGSAPFAPTTSLDVIHQKEKRVGVPFRLLFGGVRKKLVRLACDCMAPQPDERPDSPDALVQELSVQLQALSRGTAEEIVAGLSTGPAPRG